MGNDRGSGSRRFSRAGKGKIHHSPTEVIGPVPRSAVSKGTTGPGEPEKGRQRTRNPQQKLELATLPLFKDPPTLARQDGATDSCYAITKHVIPNAPQQLQSEGLGPVPQKNKSATEISDTHQPISSIRSVGIDTQRKAVADANGNAPITKKSRDTKQHINGSTDDKGSTMQSEKVQPKTNFRRLTLSLPRKPESWGKRSARKKSTLHLKTEVDWNEDLRPTDDDSVHANSKDEGTSVSSPDPESTYEYVEKLNHKRKGSNAETNSGKRRKPAKRTANIRRESSQPPRLHLTSLTAEHTMSLKPGSIASNTKVDLLPGGRPQDSLSAQKSHGSDQNEPAIQQHDIIEITSSPVVSESTSLDHGIDVLRGQTYRVIGKRSDGRGKTVGQKLADALHGVQLNSQLRPAVETTLHSTHKEHDGSNRQEAASPSSRMPTTDGSQSQDSQVLDHGIKQTQVSLGLGQNKQGFSGAFQLTRATLFTSEMANLCNTDGSEIVAKRQGLLTGRDVVHIKIGSHGVDDYNPTQNHLQKNHAQGSLETVDAMKNALQGVIQAPRAVSEYGTDSSSQNSPETGTKTLPATYFRIRNNGTHQTPESQKPLLRLQTPIQATASILGGFKTAIRSSIVDSKGSPRLMLQGNLATDKAHSPLKDVQLSSDVDIPDPSSSNYDKDSDGYSLDSSEDEVSWSKYQRDMFMEYGFQNASTKKSRAESPPLKGAFNTENNNAVLDQQNTKGLTVEPVPGTSIIHQCHAHGIDQNRTAEIESGPNQVFTDEIRAYADRNAVAPLSTEVLRTSKAVPEAQKFSQPSESNPLDWITSLQAAQKSAHDLLLETNQRLSSQLAAEQETIRQVLHIYRQGCNRILDDLSQAQQVRMGLYQRQMTAVKEQHRQICQELVLGLQDLDHRVQGE
ncbi:uncharacterized protein N7503_009120 [Penicillium pulvis]|uniref:uncharacterized protein n=1 Tax=Penicillium pulvis TaxID=1562058 RepID=UPI0025484337|nr:uncharacterized protein N7503_009120 [Penicillium pulvis]KAJ5793142.1 hypothetical protein N7503_009120 [Penicillium pulvis]